MLSEEKICLLKQIHQWLSMSTEKKSFVFLPGKVNNIIFYKKQKKTKKVVKWCKNDNHECSYYTQVPAKMFTKEVIIMTLM